MTHLIQLHGRERGQSAVVVALLLFAMIGMLALTFDGANGYFKRRLAQTAADAGALAGARELCLTGSATSAATVANDYAIGHNEALQSDTVVSGGLVTVTTAITFPTTFGNVLGVPEMVAGAQAAAGCFVPTGGTGVLPVAWACKPPDIGHDDPIFESTCEQLNDPGKIYVIMDSGSASSDYYCQDPPNSGQPPGGLDCDIDGDGYDDIFAGGGRSWLDLNGGGGGSNELRDWVNGAYAGEIHTHTWLANQTGVANDVFQAAAGRVGQEVVLPVFDVYCDQAGALPASSCPGYYHPEDVTIPGGGTAAVYYHIISFSIFHITCVDAPGVSNVPPGGCPGKNAAVAAGAPHNSKTIEGYFVEGYVPGFTGELTDGVYAGVFTLYLTK